MTDITDQDRRTAREWAEKIDPTYRGNSEPLINAARVILATVDAPEPTIADEIRGLPDFTMSGENCINDCHERADTLATRVEQMGHDLTESRAQVKRFRDLIVARTAERDEALAEVERLTAFTSVSDNGTVTRYAKGGLVDKAIREGLDRINTAHKGAVQCGDTTVTDPADVKPGEAWLVECRGERRAAVKDNGIDIPWNTINADGWYLSEDNGDVTLIARLVPAPRVITNPDELDRAKRCTVIRDSVGATCERAVLGDGWFTTRNRTDQTPYIEFPATVLWEPEA